MGMPAFTFPSSATAVAFCLMAGAIPGAVPVPLDRMTVPEGEASRLMLAAVGDDEGSQLYVPATSLVRSR